MSVTEKWKEPEQGLARLEQFKVLRPTLVAMRRLIELVKSDAALSDVAPVLSHASLVLSRGAAARRVGASWQAGAGYQVYFVEPPFECSEPTSADEHSVLRVLRAHLEEIERAATRS